jgi:hypothetical protein
MLSNRQSVPNSAMSSSYAGWQQSGLAAGSDYSVLTIDLHRDLANTARLLVREVFLFSTFTWQPGSLAQPMWSFHIGVLLSRVRRKPTGHGCNASSSSPRTQRIQETGDSTFEIVSATSAQKKTAVRQRHGTSGSRRLKSAYDNGCGHRLVASGRGSHSACLGGTTDAPSMTVDSQSRRMKTTLRRFHILQGEQRRPSLTISMHPGPLRVCDRDHAIGDRQAIGEGAGE